MMDHKGESFVWLEDGQVGMTHYRLALLKNTCLQLVGAFTAGFIIRLILSRLQEHQLVVGIAYPLLALTSLEVVLLLTCPDLVTELLE